MIRKALPHKQTYFQLAEVQGSHLYRFLNYLDRLLQLRKRSVPLLLNLEDQLSSRNDLRLGQHMLPSKAFPEKDVPPVRLVDARLNPRPAQLTQMLPHEFHLSRYQRPLKQSDSRLLQPQQIASFSSVQHPRTLRSPMDFHCKTYASEFHHLLSERQHSFRSHQYLTRLLLKGSCCAPQLTVQISANLAVQQDAYPSQIYRVEFHQPQLLPLHTAQAQTGDYGIQS